MKASRNAYLRTLSGEPLIVVDGLSLKGGNPRWLLPIIETLNDDPIRIRIFLTYLTSLRSITLKPILNVSTITDPFTGTVDVTNKELWLVMRAMGFITPSHRFTESSTSSHMSTKKGPVGQAIVSSVSELTFLPQELITDIKLLGGEKLGNDITNLTDKLDILQ